MLHTLSRTIALGLMISALVGPVGAEDEPPTSFRWSAPMDATGPAAFRVSLDFAEDNECDIYMETAGRVVGADRTPYVFVGMADGGSTIGGSEFLQAHHGSLEAAYSPGPSPGAYVIQNRIDGVNWAGANGSLDLTILNVGLASWENEQGDVWHPALFEVSCQGPIESVVLMGSRDVFPFGQGNLGGSGASVLLSASVNVADGFVRSFTNQHVEVSIDEWAFDGAAYREWTLDTPNHVHARSGWIANEGDSARVVDGAGMYSFELTRAGAAEWNHLFGWVAGYDPVDDLNVVLG